MSDGKKNIDKGKESDPNDAFSERVREIFLSGEFQNGYKERLIKQEALTRGVQGRDDMRHPSGLCRVLVRPLSFSDSDDFENVVYYWECLQSGAVAVVPEYGPPIGMTVVSGERIRMPIRRICKIGTTVREGSVVEVTFEPIGDR